MGTDETSEETDDDPALSSEDLVGIHRYQAEVAEEDGDVVRAAFHRDLARVHELLAGAESAPPTPEARIPRRPWGRRRRR